MTDLNREMGEVKAQLRYHTQELHEIKSDVKALLQFKWRIAGFAAFAAFIATMAVEIVRGR
jgi:hypothetical protein